MQYVFSVKLKIKCIFVLIALGGMITGCPSSEETKVTGGVSSASLTKNKGSKTAQWLNPDRSGQAVGADAYLADRRITDLTAMGTEDAWSEGADNCDSVKVAVIDSAIDMNHEDLEGNIILGWDEVDYDTNPSPPDFDSLTTEQKYIDQRDTHGTHVAGIIGAVGDNSIGVSGICKKAQIIAIKALDGRSGAVSDVVEAIAFADQLGAQVINASWGVGSYVQSLYDAIASRPHILFIVAAGNSSLNIDAASYSPATFSRNLSNVITVGAASANNATIGFTSFSNYGVQTVQIAAPGSYILSTIPKSCPRGGGACGRYAELSGTSMAAPFVSGVVALLWADQPHLSPSQIKQKLLDYSVDGGGSQNGASTQENILNNKIQNNRFLHIGDTF